MYIVRHTKLGSPWNRCDARHTTRRGGVKIDGPAAGRPAVSNFFCSLHELSLTKLESPKTVTSKGAPKAYFAAATCVFIHAIMRSAETRLHHSCYRSKLTLTVSPSAARHHVLVLTSLRPAAPSHSLLCSDSISVFGGPAFYYSCPLDLRSSFPDLLVP